MSSPSMHFNVFYSKLDEKLLGWGLKKRTHGFLDVILSFPTIYDKNCVL